jgi:hypothetical protein
MSDDLDEYEYFGDGGEDTSSNLSVLSDPPDAVVGDDGLCYAYREHGLDCLKARYHDGNHGDQ